MTDREQLGLPAGVRLTAQRSALLETIARWDGSFTALELHERTRRHWVHPPGTLYPDVLPLLRALAGKVAIGVLANQEATVVDALTRDGVAPFVDVWGVSALVGYEKPSPDLFRWCLAQAGCAPEQAVHVGNRLDTDVRPAAALGQGMRSRDACDRYLRSHPDHGRMGASSGRRPGPWCG